jgi:PII-like signaling protein
VNSRPDIAGQPSAPSGEKFQEGLKLTTYFGERSRVKGVLLADELLDIHARHGIHSSILLRGVQGFGAKHRLRSDRLLTLSEDLPLVCVAVDVREQIERLRADVSSIRHEGLLTLEQVRLYGGSHESKQEIVSDEAERSPVAEAAIDRGQAVQDPVRTAKLTVYLGRHERIDGSPAFTAVCRTLHEIGVAGATVLLGVDGTRTSARERARFFARNHNVPLMVVSVGDQHQISAGIGRLEQMLSEPLFTLEDVRVCKQDGLLLEQPHDETSTGIYGMDPRQKLTIVSSEAALHERRSVYVELVRRLRAAGAAGATSMRGIWGFHGDHEPHGDRLLAIRRHVPVVTETIDTPERIAALFPIVDELTQEQGLVTSELVPANSALHSAPGL